MKNIINAVEEFEMKDHWMTQGDRKGRTTLHHAAIYGYKSVLEFIVNQVIESFEDEDMREQFLNVPDLKGRTPLFYAAVERRVSVVRFIIEKGANLESVTNDKHIEPGSTILMACAEKNSVECFDILMDKGADILATREDGADATYIAARYGHLDIIQLILENKKYKSIINRPTFRGRTALVTAACHGHLQVCKTLFAKGADLNYQDENKFTALIYAANEGHFDMVKWLLENGANVHLKDTFGETALTAAETNGHIEIIRFLRNYQKFNEESEENESDKIAKKGGKGRRKTVKEVFTPSKALLNRSDGKRMSR